MTINTKIKPAKRWYFRDLAEWILTKYYNHPDVILNIMYNDTVCDHFSTEDIKIDAILDKLSIPHNYNLIIREYADLKTIIPHEMIHLHQYEIGDLKVNKFENQIVFNYKGEEYDPSTPYEDRPWENEAHELDDKLYRLYKKQKKEAK